MNSSAYLYRVDSINSHRYIAFTVLSFFLPLTRLYPVSFVACLGHVARYTPSTTDQIASAKLRLFGKVNF